LGHQNLGYIPKPKQNTHKKRKPPKKKKKKEKKKRKNKKTHQKKIREKKKKKKNRDEVGERTPLGERQARLTSWGKNEEKKRKGQGCAPEKNIVMITKVGEKSALDLWGKRARER